MEETRKRTVNPMRLIFKGIASLGIGLLAAAVWWEYSEQILAKILPIVGLGG